MQLPTIVLCLLSFLIGISLTNSWHDFRRKYYVKKETCSKGGVHNWHLIQVFRENDVDYSGKEFIVHQCTKCRKQEKYLH